MSTVFVGFDLGSSCCHQVVLNSDGSLHLSRSIPTSEHAVRNAFANLGSDVRVHLEASELSDWIYSIIKLLVSQIIVSHPRSLAWIGKDSNKTDSIDARKLAELLRLNRFHEVYYQANDSRRIFKQLVVHHEELSREQARLKAKIKARLRCCGFICKGANVFSQSGQIELLEKLTPFELRKSFEQSFAILNKMLDSVAAEKRAMLSCARQFPEVKLLQTAPGVGSVTACRFVAYLQTPARFSNKRKLWRYSRLAITRRESNKKRLSHPRLDSAGVGSLKDCSRKVFEAALRTKADNSFKRAFEQSLARTKNRAHARLSTQRKILATLRAMWLKEQPYCDDLN